MDMSLYIRSATLVLSTEQLRVMDKCTVALKMICRGYHRVLRRELRGILPLE